MAYIDKTTTLQRVVSFYSSGGHIHFEGVLIDEHLLVGRYYASDFGEPIISMEWEDFKQKVESFPRDLEWVIIDKPEQLEPREDFKASAPKDTKQ